MLISFWFPFTLGLFWFCTFAQCAQHARTLCCSESELFPATEAAGGDASVNIRCSCCVGLPLPACCLFAAWLDGLRQAGALPTHMHSTLQSMLCCGILWLRVPSECGALCVCISSRNQQVCVALACSPSWQGATMSHGYRPWCCSTAHILKRKVDTCRVQVYSPVPTPACRFQRTVEQEQKHAATTL